MHPLITSELACSRQEDLRRDALPRAPRRRRGRRVALVAAALVLALTGTAHAAFVHQAGLTASDGAANDILGASLAISGNTVVVAAPGQRAAYVYEKAASGWADAKQVAKLKLPDNGGTSIGAVAVAGDTVAIGAPDKTVNQHVEQGGVFVFVKPAAGWKDAEPSALLTASDGAVNDTLGNGVAASGDTIVATAAGHKVGGNDQQGAAYVFVKPPSGWDNETQAAELTASDGASRDALSSVAIDGDTVVAGAPHHAVGASADQGAAYVFVKPDTGWKDMVQVSELTASDGAAGDQGGLGVAISGGTAVVGAPFHQVGLSQEGAAYVFVKTFAGWSRSQTQTAELSPSDGATNDRFGAAVAVADDTAVVGSLLHQVGPNEAQGAAYLYRKPVTTWASTTETQELTAPDGAAHDILGDTVAARAGVVVAGAPFATVGGNQAQGAVHLFRVPPTVTIAAPADGATFIQGQVVNAAYECAAASDGTITTCSGPVSSGAPVDTAALGPHTFTVDARDSEGGSASRSVGYTVVAPSPPPPPPGKPVLSKLRAKKGRITFKLSRAVPVTLRLAKCATRCRAIRHRSVRGRSGPNVVKLKLGRGRYKITATPLGGLSRSVRFRVVKHT